MYSITIWWSNGKSNIVYAESLETAFKIQDKYFKEHGNIIDMISINEREENNANFN